MIHVNNLHKSFGKNDVLKGINFDVYEGEHIEADYRSLAYNLQFRSMEGTLNDEDIDGNIQAIIDALAEINCRLR